MKKRFLSLLMATAVVLTTTTSPVFAAEEDVQDSSAAAISASGLCEHHSQHTAECGYVPAAEGASCTFVCEICNSVEGGGEETNVCICTELCTAEAMNQKCPVCGAEGATPEGCALYEEPAPDAEQPAPARETAVENWRSSSKRISRERAQIRAISLSHCDTGNTSRIYYMWCHIRCQSFC